MFNFLRKPEEPKPLATDGEPDKLAELLKNIVVRLVDNPDDVEVREVQGDRTTILEIKVDEQDMGKVIGKKGRIIKSLRIVMRAAAVHEGKNVSVELVD